MYSTPMEPVMRWPVTAVAISRTVKAVGGAVLASTVWAGSAMAASEPIGVWTDHTGRGAVEISQCGTALCGHIVWTVDSKHNSMCGKQVIGDVRPIRTGTWDKGWIYNPDDDKKYDLELKTIGTDKLQITGYMGSKLLSQTMTWRRAPADLRLCTASRDAIEARAPSSETQPGVASAPVSPSPSLQTEAPQTQVPAAEGEAATPPPPAPEQGDSASPTKQRQARADRRSKADANGDDIAVGGLTIKRERTRAGHQCNLAYQQFKLTFPCPD